VRRSGIRAAAFGCIGTAAAAALLPGASAAVAAKPVTAVTTPGSGNLTICRDWLVYNTCDTYHHVALPRRVAAGDKFQVTFGSNPKMVEFHVIGIRRHGKSCTLLSPHTGAHESGEKIVVGACGRAPKPAVAR
jgi:hypothetical protein